MKHSTGRTRAATVLLAMTLAITALTACAPGATALPDRAKGVERAKHSSTGTDTRPNVVMIMADDMRFDDLAWAPNVRSLLAAEGVSMENAFSPYPLCCPARASFFTGMLTHNHHVWTHEEPYAYRVFDDSKTLATSLSGVGYSTGMAGKYLNGYGGATSTGGRAVKRLTAKMTSSRLGKAGAKGKRVALSHVRSSESIESWRKVPNGWDEWHVLMEPSRSLRKVGVSGRGPTNYYNAITNDNGVPHSRKGRYTTNVIARDTIGMVKTFAAKDKPFFVAATFTAPHCGNGSAAEVARDRSRGISGDKDEDECTPTTPKKVHGKFDAQIARGMGITLDGFSEADANGDGRDTTADVADKPGLFGSFSSFTADQASAVREASRQRAEAVYVMDRKIGDIIATLKRTGEWDNTYVVFTSDNGFFQGEHHRMQGKVLGYEPVLRVPMIVTGPGLRGAGAQQRFDPITLVDLTATILDWTDAPAPVTPDGASKANIIATGDRGWTEAVPVEQAEADTLTGGYDPAFRGSPMRSYGVRTPRYTYVRYADATRELYDLRRDPMQWTNVASDPDYADVVADLDQVWAAGKNCAGSACRITLPAKYQMTAAENRAQTEHWRSSIRATYGR